MQISRPRRALIAAPGDGEGADRRSARLQQGEAGIGSIVIRAPEVQIGATAPPPLFTTADDFVTFTLKLIANKALEDDDEDEQ